MAGEIQLNSVTLATESGGVASIDSSVDIKGPLNASGSAPIYACRAWVNFNGTGTVAIRASGNVSSITDNGTGDYTVNFTTAMSDANHSAVSTAGQTAATRSDNAVSISFSTTAYRLETRDGSNNALDNPYTTVAVFR